MDGRDGVIRIGACIMLLCLAACGCKPDKGDDTSIKGYWSGCLAEAKG